MAKAVAILAAFALVFIAGVRARDPDILHDFLIPEGMEESTIDGTFFTYTGLRNGAPSSGNDVAKKNVGMTDFSALNGMGLSLQMLDFPAGTVNAPHSHPRGAEMLYVVDGSLTVGTVDTKGKGYKNVLQKGDLFVFPQGLPHYQANMDKSNKAVAVSVFSSADAGTASLPQNLFGSNIPDDVLMKAFKISAEVLQAVKKPYSDKL